MASLPPVVRLGSFRGKAIFQPISSSPSGMFLSRTVYCQDLLITSPHAILQQLWLGMTPFRCNKVNAHASMAPQPLRGDLEHTNPARIPIILIIVCFNCEGFEEAKLQVKNSIWISICAICLSLTLFPLIWNINMNGSKFYLSTLFEFHLDFE